MLFQTYALMAMRQTPQGITAKEASRFMRTNGFSGSIVQTERTFGRLMDANLVNRHGVKPRWLYSITFEGLRELEERLALPRCVTSLKSKMLVPK